MKSILASILFILLWTMMSVAQIYNPVKWEDHSIKTGEGTYDIIFEAEIENGWYIYSQYLKGEDGPIPTSFNFDVGDHFTSNGKTEECELNRVKVFDKLFDMELVKYNHKAIFRQSITAKDVSKPLVGYFEYMTCDKEKCLPPAMVDFSIDLSKSKDAKSLNYSTSSLCDNKLSFATPTMPDVEEDRQSEKSNLDREQKDGDKKINPDKKKDQAPKVNKANNPYKVQGVDAADASDGLEDPVKWNVSINRNEAGEAALNIDGTIEKGWQIYSNTMLSEDGPIKTNIALDTSMGYRTIGPIIEKAEKIITGYDKYFDMEVTKLKVSASLTQKIEILDESFPIKGYFEYIACNDSRCLTPQYVDFSADVRTGKVLVGDELLAGETINPLELSQLEKMYGLDYQDLQEPVGDCVEVIEENNSLWKIFTLGFIGGLIALLTPCVFPMIPLTVSFFTKSAEKKGKGLFNAMFYGASILLVYVLISVPFHLLDTVNPNILNDISTNMWLNIFFFVIFIFFAYSFFGYFDLTLPASVTNKISAAEGVGGILGIFFMALTLALVSFSCTGPILGSLLAGSLSSDGGAWQLTSGFAGFGLALGLPFGLFAAFPSMMNSLPRSGGWLNTVKVVLGFVELALAFKFLSNADLVKQWGILKIEPFLIIWILIALGLALYLFGKIKFPHDSPIKKLSLTRMTLGVACLAFGIYMMTGFRYSERIGSYEPLVLLSGLAPPVCYSFVYECKCPQGLDCKKDLAEGIAFAKSVGKPILLDFTGHACVNCRKMEEHVWPLKEVYPYLKDEYVLISLYVDEKIALPVEEQVVLPKRAGGTQKMRFTGNEWSYLQSEYFNNNSQPYYVLMTPEGVLLNNPVGYTPDENAYAEFLECGLRNYRALKKY